MERSFTDQIGHTITIETSPKRIISLVPSQTELLAYLGLDDEVAGITKFCIHPEIWFRTKTRVGGTKNVNFEKIEHLNPDLIICNKEENKESEVRALMEKYPVWTSDIHNLDDSLAMINSIGDMVNKQDEVKKLAAKIKNNFKEFEKTKPAPKRVVYLIWKDPYMAAGKDTFIDYTLSTCNFKNVCIEALGRYPQLSMEQIKNLQPELILLSSEPFPFTEKHLTEFKSYFPESIPVLVDGEYFSWYGSRLVDAPQYFKSLIENSINV